MIKKSHMTLHTIATENSDNQQWIDTSIKKRESTRGSTTTQLKIQHRLVGKESRRIEDINVNHNQAMKASQGHRTTAKREAKTATVEVKTNVHTATSKPTQFYSSTDIDI